MAVPRLGRVSGAPERIRTSDLPLRRGPRYPAVPPGRNALRQILLTLQASRKGFIGGYLFGGYLFNEWFTVAVFNVPGEVNPGILGEFAGVVLGELNGLRFGINCHESSFG